MKKILFFIGTFLLTFSFGNSFQHSNKYYSNNYSNHYSKSPKNTFSYSFKNGVLTVFSNIDGASRYYTRIHNKYNKTLRKLKVDYRKHLISGLKDGEVYIIKNAYYHKEKKEWFWNEIKVKLIDTTTPNYHYNKYNKELNNRYRDKYNDRYNHNYFEDTKYIKLESIYKRKIDKLEFELNKLKEENIYLRNFLKQNGYRVE